MFSFARWQNCSRHKSRRTLCQARTVHTCVHSVGMLCGYMPNSSLWLSFPLQLVLCACTFDTCTDKDQSINHVVSLTRLPITQQRNVAEAPKLAGPFYVRNCIPVPRSIGQRSRSPDGKMFWLTLQVPTCWGRGILWRAACRKCDCFVFFCKGQFRQQKRKHYVIVIETATKVSY